MAAAGRATTSPTANARVTRCERRDGALYPPKIVPRQKPANRLAYISDIIKDPLLAITPAAYEQPMIVRETPARLVSACVPELVRTVLVDRRQDFDEKPAVQRQVLGGLLGNGILLAEGAEWRWQRLTAAPLFRYSEILAYVPAMSEAATATLGTWAARSGGVHDITVDMTLTTYDVIARTILVGGSEAISEEIGRERGSYQRAVRWAMTYGLLKLPAWLPRPGRAVMNRHDVNLRAIVGEMIGAHRAEDGTGDDLLARLLAAKHPDTGEVMTRGQLIDNILTFLLAGHHTTAMALTWTLYLLACAPEWQERLYDEIRTVAPEGPVTADQVGKLVMTQQVLKEAMRLFPPVPFVARVATRDTELGGHAVAKGTLISIPIYVVHRHKTVWSDPDRFDPSRFAEGSEPRPVSCQFLPFGAGPRICIGSAFAVIEGTVLLATLLRGARFALATPDFSPVPVSSIVLEPQGGMPLAVTVRD